ncbi:unnamed protein product [Rotaria sp. Silwood2]|nr:unnamed protein product [Rotaria sp. Silwood2]CAF3947277.1 unnamed protein product [Rotaria sp. Silwood2]
MRSSIASIRSLTRNTCSCMGCQSGSNCSPNIDVGFTTAFSCSSSACTESCHKKYPSLCPSSFYLDQTNGTCISQSNVNTRCQCRCCNMNGCRNYIANTNKDCTSCYASCQQQSLCGIINTVTYRCNPNQSKISMEFSLLLIYFHVNNCFIIYADFELLNRVQHLRYFNCKY